MRFFIVILIIGAVCFYGYRAAVGTGPRDLIRGGVDKLANVASNGVNPQSKSASTPTDGAAASTSGGFVGAVGTDLNKEGPKALQVVYFTHREVPAVELLTLGNALGCTFTVDQVARSVAVVGPLEGVTLCRDYLLTLDKAPGSCAVKAWAVFVEKSVQRGFDLVAAIRAVADVPSTLTVGSGGLTLDLGVGDLSLALDAIADGSTVEVIQRPHVQLFQGVTSKIESIEEVPIPSTSVSQGVSQTSIEFRKVGLQLDVTPCFLGSDRLKLGVIQTNGLVGKLVKIAGNEVPSIQSQTVSGTVEMSVGQSIVLGGVTTLRTRTSKGLLGEHTETSEGSLYVVLSTYYDVPRAVAVYNDLDAPLRPVPLSAQPVDASSGVLPPKGWLSQQFDFIMGR